MCTGLQSIITIIASRKDREEEKALRNHAKMMVIVLVSDTKPPQCAVRRGSFLGAQGTEQWPRWRRNMTSKPIEGQAPEMEREQEPTKR